MVSDAKNEGTETHESVPTSDDKPSKKEIYENTLSGTHDQRRFPLLRSDSHSHQRLAHSLSDFKAQEGAQREERLKEVWKRLPNILATTSSGSGNITVSSKDGATTLTQEKANELKEMYQNELLGRCRHDADAPATSGTSGSAPPISWKNFYKYAEAKEVGPLFSFFM